MAWTEAQQAAIDSRGQNLLLSAAAGSGKTAVLVERIIQRLLDETDPVEVTELLVVTFTKAAAAEMRDRIGQRLQAALEEREDPRIERQLALLGSAQISTLHAFCQTVIRQYFYTIGIDPKSKIASEEELAVLRRDVLAAVLLRRYEEHGEGKERFLELADRFSNERSDDGLMYLIEKLYTFSRSMPWPQVWLDRVAENYHIEETADIDSLPWAKEIIKALRIQLEECAGLYRTAVRLAKEPEGPEDYLPLLQEEGSLLDPLLEGASWKEIERQMALFSFDRLPSKAKKNMTVEELELREQAKALRDSAKKIIKDLQTSYFSVPHTEWIRQLSQLYPYVRLLIDVTEEFAAAYSEEKKAKGLMDFSDLEQRCLEILLAPESTPEDPIPSEVAKELRRRFKEVLVDEYQDTNGVQEMIAALVSGADNRFMVGDIKQSIYRFRLADPGLFLEKYRTYQLDAAAACRRIDLSKNFRSDAIVLDAVNYIFERIMTPGSAEMGYGEREKLYPGRMLDEAPKNFIGETVEVHVIECAKKEEDLEAAETDTLELTAFEEEAYCIADRILALKEEGFQIAKKDGSYEPLDWNHIVILLRSMSRKADVLLDVLRRAGIPAFADQSSGYFEAAEVRFIRSLLACIDNPLQDIPLAAVLHSPLVGLSMEALARLRLEGDGYLWNLLPAYQAHYPKDRERVQNFIERLEAWRTAARQTSVSRLILQLYKETGYLEYVGSLEDGALRQANLKAFYDRACQYEQSDFRSLFRFLRFLDRMEEEGLDLAPPPAAGEKENVVRVMSIHKSKGLEFPVVILADGAKEFNRQDMNSTALFHQNWGIGLKQYNSRWRMWYPTLSWHAVRHQMERESKAEEQRVLYVALTRAKDKLIITGRSKNLEQDRLRWESHDDYLRDSRILNSRSYLDWIMKALLLHPEAGVWKHGLEYALCETELAAGYWRLWLHEPRGIAQNKEAEAVSQKEWTAVEEGVPIGHALPEEIRQRLSWKYGHEAAVRTPAKVSVSEIKERRQTVPEEYQIGQELVGEDEVFSRRPAWKEEAVQTGGTAYGTLIHRCMQYIDIQKTDSEEEIAAQTAQMYTDGVTEEPVPKKAIRDIAAFFASPLGQRMKEAAHTVEREVPFSLLLDAGWYEEAARGERIFVQGVIDGLWQEADGLVLVDYKTDRVGSMADLKARYSVQLELYREAMRRIRQNSAVRAYIYSVFLREYIEI